MAENNGQDVRVPWFSGLCLEGEVAGQYEMECSGSQQQGQDTTKAGLLELDGLAPITIFVGANNSGKSRLMRELFKTEQLPRFKLKSRNGGCSVGWMRFLVRSPKEPTSGWRTKDHLGQILLTPAENSGAV